MKCTKNASILGMKCTKNASLLVLKCTKKERSGAISRVLCADRVCVPVINLGGHITAPFLRSLPSGSGEPPSNAGLLGIATHSVAVSSSTQGGSLACLSCAEGRQSSLFQGPNITACRPLAGMVLCVARTFLPPKRATGRPAVFVQLCRLFRKSRITKQFRICRYCQCFAVAKNFQRGAACNACTIPPCSSISFTSAGSMRWTCMSSVCSWCCASSGSTPVARKV